ncbi:hypothetical protein OIU74_025923 [Salix koriyanagi]|uniref:Uncharacterized protein n=1 Tax=Salix koriyanagi TaxID=2511006 RepID=A0A9Q0W2T1_9ROSI|nr:hypothetical protein OIU74_025923 [Salix koriyanagi]
MSWLMSMTNNTTLIITQTKIAYLEWKWSSINSVH